MASLSVTLNSGDFSKDVIFGKIEPDISQLKWVNYAPGPFEYYDDIETYLTHSLSVKELYLNRVVIKESSPDHETTEHGHTRPKPTKTKTYDLSANDHFWNNHRGR